MNEVTLYNLHSKSSSARSAAEDAGKLALSLMIKHLRNEHGMHLNEIAKRCGLKVREVKDFL